MQTFEKAQEYFKKHGGADLTVGDIQQIKSEAESKDTSYPDILWNAIGFAYYAGWNRGFKSGKKKSHQ